MLFHPAIFHKVNSDVKLYKKKNLIKSITKTLEIDNLCTLFDVF